MTSEIEKLLTDLREVYLGPNWTEVALQDALNGVDSDLAFTEPPGGRNSIAQVVCHLVYIRQYLIKKLQGDVITTMEQDESFHTLTYGASPPEAWPQLLRTLHAAYEQLNALLAAKNNDFLEQQALPRDYNFRYLIAGIIQHEAYHTGQLQLLKKQLQQLAALN